MGIPHGCAALGSFHIIFPNPTFAEHPFPVVIKGKLQPPRILSENNSHPVSRMTNENKWHEQVIKFAERILCQRQNRFRPNALCSELNLEPTILDRALSIDMQGLGLFSQITNILHSWLLSHRSQPLLPFQFSSGPLHRQSQGL